MKQIDFKLLKEKQRLLREGFPATMGLRVHRAISWIGRAEAERIDPDAAFIFFWIAFNATYADETDFGEEIPLGERRQFVKLIERLVALDEDARIHAAIWDRFRGPIAKLMENRYVYRPFWQNQNGVPGTQDWARKWRKSADRFVRSMADKNTAFVLREVFDRLYMLRCQMIHGGTTWNSKVNRSQVKDGAAILGTLLPVMIDIMLDNPEEDWGTPFYPVVKSVAQQSGNAAGYNR